MATDGEPPILYRHTVCDREIRRRTVCAHCGVVSDPAEVKAILGPGMPVANL